jgi:hypothetical protein
MSDSALSSAMNDWFLSLPKGRQDILKDDKWMLAGAAFQAGMEIGEKGAKDEFIAKRHSDGSPWENRFFSLDKGVYAHADTPHEALRASSATELKAAVYDLLCTGVNPRLTSQALGVYSILKSRDGVFDEVIEEGFIPAFAFDAGFEEPACRLFNRIVEGFPAKAFTVTNPINGINHSLAYYWGLLCCASRILKFELPVEDGKGGDSFSEQSYFDARRALQDANRLYWREEQLREHSQKHFENLALMAQQAARRCGLTLEHFGYKAT